MKYLLLFSFLLPCTFFAQDMFSSLDKSEMSTSILYDRAFTFADITDNSKKINASYFIQVHSELAQADYSGTFTSDQIYKKAQFINLKDKVVPLGLINVDFDIINPELIENGTISVNDNEVMSNASNGSIFQSKSRSLLSPLVPKHEGLKVNYVLNSDFIFNSSDREVITIKANFNDGLGLREISIDQNISVNYTVPGEKKIEFIIQLNNGEFIENSSYINIIESTSDMNARAPGDESDITEVFASTAYQGEGEGIAHIGKGLYKIYFDNVDGVFDKPIIFVDGFDPGNGRNIPLMYDLLNFGDPQQNLAELVRDEGFDLVVLDFPVHVSTSDGTTVLDGGADFIQRNAFVLIELMGIINNLKVGDEENVVIGPSMGGLISRYGLRYMEQNALDHETRLYMSFDSPHLGANVPIGLQYLFNYMVNGDPGLAAAEPLVDGLLNSAAAKQMLVDHYLGHVDGSGVEQDPSKTLAVGAPNFRDAFQAEINAMGFPQNTRNVAVINGAGDGSADLTGSPGMLWLDNNFPTSGITSADITLRFTPDASQSAVVSDFVGYLFGAPVLFFDASADSPSFSSGLDSAPGGLFVIDDLAEDGDPLITSFVNSMTLQVFDFIPSVSGLALATDNGEINWNHDIDLDQGGRSANSNVSSRNTLNSTPFANWYIPDTNEIHVDITEGNVAFALSEILQLTLTDQQLELSELQIESNPIENSIVFITSKSLIDVTISITDITGKQVLNLEHQDIYNGTKIGVDFSAGIYILDVKDDSGSFRTKIVKK